jgi:hypothetical protein
MKRVPWLPGKRLVVGADPERGLEASRAEPTQADLDEILMKATRVVVSDLGSRRKKRLLDTEEASDLESLREALRIRDAGTSHFHDMCLGDFEFTFWDGRSPLPSLTLDHGKALGLEPFGEKAALVASDPILDWLAAHGIPQARDQFGETQRQLAELERVSETWRSAAPRAVRSLMDDPAVGESELAAALVREHPDPVERARVVLEWFGSGEDRWLGFSYQDSLPENLLMEMPLEALLEAAQQEPRTDALLEGAVRLFAGWRFGTTRKQDLRRIPRGFNRVLLQHGMRSPGRDKRARAKRAFR